MSNRDLLIDFAIERFQRDLRLGDWDIRYSPEWAGGEDSATIVRHTGSRSAVIRIDPDVTGDNIDAHVAHELMHLVLAQYTDVAMGVAAAQGPGMERVLDILSDMEEVICDRVAHALTGVTFLPVGEQRKTFAPFDTSPRAHQDAGVVLHNLQGEAK